MQILILLLNILMVYENKRVKSQILTEKEVKILSSYIQKFEMLSEKQRLSLCEVVNYNIKFVLLYGSPVSF